MLVAAVAALSTVHPEANPALQGDKVYDSEEFVNKQIYRIIGNIPTIAANCYRHRIGKPFNEPRNDLSYVENFLYMMDYLNDKDFKPHPELVRILDVLFILHAEHELNCSTSAVRHLCSSGVDMYTCVAGGISALYGPKHGGANEAVLRMLEDIGSMENIPKYIEDVKNKKKVLYGFGHRVYKSYDPRAKIVKVMADRAFAILGKEPLIEMAQKLEQIALNDEYFKKRDLYPNVDFYSGVIYKCMGFPTDMFVVLFAIPRIAGWLSHWKEQHADKENKIYRPRQNYVGARNTNYTPIGERKEVQANLKATETSLFRRRNAKF